MNQKIKKVIEQLLSNAGISINGSNAWDIQVHNKQFYERVLLQPELGMGEAYMEGWWDCEKLDDFFFRILRNGLENHVKDNKWFLMAHLFAKIKNLKPILFNLQSKQRAFVVGERHYDIGNDIYKVMLDERMNYSCGYWKDAATLDQAQEAKLDLVCKKLQLEPGMKVLDIGCGWGAFSKYAAEKYQASVVGVTVSKEQQRLGQELCAGLPVTILLQDYRDLNEKFDRICSIGMFEHVGYKNYSTYMQVVARCLQDDGLFLLHSIGNNYSLRVANPWVSKYIFPNGALPSMQQIGKAKENLFVMEDWHNFGADYDKTLMAWQENFVNHWQDLKKNYSEKFYRMWNFYLLSCAGGFRAREIQLWQLVLSKKGILGGYQSVR